MAREIGEKGAGALSGSSSSRDIDRFLGEVKAAPRAGAGRLVFALDATMSRQPSWDRAMRLQGEMFDAVGRTGDLSVQLVYFRGFGECRASRWVARTDALRDLMTAIDCRGGQTQIGRVLRHAAAETRKTRVGAVVFIGDAVEENADELCRTAGELGVLGVPCFLFQDGGDQATEQVFRELARLSGGAYRRLDERSADALGDLLRAVARFISQGPAALESETSKEGRLLLQEMRGSGRGR